MGGGVREYAQVAPTFWIGDTGKQIRKCGPEAQLLALYLITSPHANMFGLYYLPMALITHETGLSAPKVKACLAKLKAVTFAQYDTDSEFVWVVEMTAYQVGNMKADDNRMKGLRRAYEALPNNPFIGQFFEKYGERYGFERRASKGLLKPSDIEMEMEQETETEQEREMDIAAPAALTLQADFVLQFQKTYEARTGQPFKTDKKDFVLAAKLINSHSLAACASKASLLADLCENKTAWFTEESGWGAFTLGKLSQFWNEILPREPEKTKDDELKAEMAKWERR